MSVRVGELRTSTFHRVVDVLDILVRNGFLKRVSFPPQICTYADGRDV